jgi:hypothetical protein
MTDALRKKLAARAKNWNTKKTPPSQLKSERLKKKLRRGQAVEPTIKTDCRDCSKFPCGKSLAMCDEGSMVGRCRQCGSKAFYRFIMGVDYICPICKEKRR